MKKIIVVILMITFFCFTIPLQSYGKSRDQYEQSGYVIWDVAIDDKKVAITFDDGPHPLFTPQILDLLAKYDMKATFFVAGNKVERFPEILKRTVKEGHEIGNHTYSHRYSKRISSSDYLSELQKTDDMIMKYTGRKPTLFRPVGGYYNETIVNTVIQNNQLVILWSWDHDAKDWQKPSTQHIVRTITKGVKPGNIILLHDWIGTEYTKSSQTVTALEEILKYLKKNGYECVTVSELLYHATEKVPEPFDPFQK